MSVSNPVKNTRHGRGLRRHFFVCGLALATVSMTGCTQLRLPQSYDSTGFDSFQRPADAPPQDQPPALAASEPAPDTQTSSERALAVERAMARANSEHQTAWDMDEPGITDNGEKLFDTAVEQVNYQQPIDGDATDSTDELTTKSDPPMTRTLVAQTEIETLDPALNPPAAIGERPAYVDPQSFSLRPQPLNPSQPAPLSVIPPASIPEVIDQAPRQRAAHQPSPLRPRLGNESANTVAQSLRQEDAQPSLDRPVTLDHAGHQLQSAAHDFASAPAPQTVPKILQVATRRDEVDTQTKPAPVLLVSQRAASAATTDLPAPPEVQPSEDLIVNGHFESPATTAAPVGFSIPVVDENLNRVKEETAPLHVEPQKDDSASFSNDFNNVQPANFIAGVAESDEQLVPEPTIADDQFFMPAEPKPTEAIELTKIDNEFCAQQMSDFQSADSGDHKSQCGCQRCDLESESQARPERFASLDNHFSATPNGGSQFNLPAINAPEHAATPTQPSPTDSLALPTGGADASVQHSVSFDAATAIDNRRAGAPQSNIPPFGVDALIAHNVVTWKSRLDDAIELADRKLANDSVDAETRASMEVSLRLLQVVRRQVENVATNDARLSDGERQYWSHQLDALTTMLASAPSDVSGSSEVQRHQSARQTLSHLREAVAQLETIANLKVSAGKFCSEITGFGQYREFESNQFAPGDRTLVYCEVENYFSSEQPTPDGNRFVTHLRGSFAVYDEEGRVVQQAEFPAVEDIALKRRRDFYLYLPVTIGELDAGNYRLHVMVEDLDGNKTGSLEPAMQFSVVGNR